MKRVLVISMLIGLLAPPAWADSDAELACDTLTADEIAALEKLYDSKLGDWYLEGPETGYYVGWRLLITKEGRWNAFVAGD